MLYRAILTKFGPTGYVGRVAIPVFKKKFVSLKMAAISNSRVFVQLYSSIFVIHVHLFPLVYSTILEGGWQ